MLNPLPTMSTIAAPGVNVNVPVPRLMELFARPVATEKVMTEVALAAMERDAVRALFLSFFDSYDLLFLPVSCLPAFPAGQDEFVVAETPIPYWQVLASCRAVSVFGVPAAVVPCGLTTDGLPVGVQIVGPPYAEALVLTAAVALEQRLGGTLTTLPAPA